ncbi:MAG TPA: hypothetical protein VKN99_03790 [Polyangia bacterium]|nr:hypothetical protein [Polyangia bacterium]
MDASSDGDGGTGLPDGAPGSSALCGLQSWTWENPLPQGNALPSVFGFSRTNAWAVGSHGTILHWNGTAWSCVAAPTQRFLNAVWGSAPDDLWAVGGDASAGIILHGDGTSWSIASTPTFTLSGVWGSGPRDVWAVGPGGRILHWDGSSWLPSPSGTTADLSRVWASGPADAWAVGDMTDAMGVSSGGIVLHWNGAEWSVAVSGANAIMVPTSVSGSAPDDVWVTGSCDEIFGFCSVLHWDGRGWSRPRFAVPYPDNGEFLSSVVVFSRGDAWALGQFHTNYHFDGAAWSAVSNCDMDGWGNEISAWGSAGDDIWAVGYPGNLCHFDGARWSRVTGGVLTDFAGIHVRGASDAWAVGPSIAHWDGAAWTQVLQSPAQSGFADVWATAANDAWAAGGAYCRQGVTTYPCGIIWHYDGASWAPVPGLSDSDPLARLWASAPNDVWAVGLGTLAHWNGTRWTIVEAHSGLWHYGVWGSAGDDVWVVGAGGRITHFTGGTWSPVASPTSEDLHGVWGSAANDVWAVGGQGTILHFAGSSWQQVASPTTDPLYSVWSEAAQAWAVGGVYSGVILHYDGATWAVEASVGARPLGALRGSDARTLRVVGPASAILHHTPGGPRDR